MDRYVIEVRDPSGDLLLGFFADRVLTPAEGRPAVHRLRMVPTEQGAPDFDLRTAEVHAASLRGEFAPRSFRPRQLAG